MILLPVTVSLALVRFLLRCLARSVLALPEAIGTASITRTFLWVIGMAFALRILCFRRVHWTQQAMALDWYWQQIRMLGYPRLLDGFWERKLTIYGPHWSAMFWPLALLAVVWTIGLVLARIVVTALRQGFSLDGDALLPLPRPAARAPFPSGILYNGIAVLIWGSLAAGFLIALPPMVVVAVPWVMSRPVRTAQAFTVLWSGLRWLGFPRLFDDRADSLRRAALDQPYWTGGPYRFPLVVKFNRPLIEFAGLNLAMLAIAGALLLSVVWGWRAWQTAASTGGALAFGSGGTRTAPRWTVVLLPLTAPLAVLGLVFWKSPVWIPKLLRHVVVLYLISWPISFVMWVVLVVRGNHESPLIVMRTLRHNWRVLDRSLHVLHWFTPWLNTFPHTAKEPPSGWDAWWALLGMSSIVALAGPLLIAGAGITVFVVKRTLEGLAR